MSTLLTTLHDIAGYFDPDAATDTPTVFAFYVAEEEPCYVVVEGKDVSIELGTHAKPSITFFTDMYAMTSVANGEAFLDQTFARFFPVPEKACHEYSVSQQAAILP